MHNASASGNATIRYALAKYMNININENQNYPFSAFISDTGGAAGLFLGLGVMGKVDHIPY